VARSHYDVLGVVPSADAEEIRRAYVLLARDAHPDRYIDASGEVRADAERRMREINAAWHVLGDARRRRRYDAERSPERQFLTNTDGTMRTDPEVLDEVDSTARLIRGLPWLLLVVIMFAIFVFTAYAVTGDAGDRGCVSVNGTSAAPADCGSPGARRVVTTVDVTRTCPSGTERLQPDRGNVAYCLEV
jgi:hypothetical protein